MESEFGSNQYDRLKEHWLIACPSRSLQTQPFACTILDVPVVLFRTSQGVAAILDRCPHRGAPFSAGRIQADFVRCPYHGWQFNRHGQCVHRPGIPASHQVSPMPAVPTFQAWEDANWIWVAICSDTSQPEFPDSDFGKLGRPIRWNDEADADWLDGIENLLDPTHTPYVHAGLVRTESSSKQFDALIKVTPSKIEVEYSNEGKQSGWISRWLERDRTVSFGRFIPPCLAQLEYRSTRGIEFLLNIYFTPTQHGKVRLFSEVYTPQSRVPHWIRRVALAPILRRVYKQDFHILKIQQWNSRRHRKNDYVAWEGDFVRGWIETWLKHGRLPESFSQRLKLQI